jgi:hypothetical protein
LRRQNPEGQHKSKKRTACWPLSVPEATMATTRHREAYRRSSFFLAFLRWSQDYYLQWLITKFADALLPSNEEDNESGAFSFIAIITLKTSNSPRARSQD